MQAVAIRYGINLLFICIISFLIVLAMNPQVLASIPAMSSAELQSFKTIFISILLEAFPFILLGVFVSSIMQTFVTERMIARWIPKNPLLGIGLACLLGILFPVCECGLIPVVRRLMLKGMPAYIAVTFILVGPIVNPVVFAATSIAFRARPEMVYARMGLAAVVAAIIGILIYFFMKKDPLKHSQTTLYANEAADHEHAQPNKLFAVLEHACVEFFDMGKFLLVGAIITASLQTFVSRASLVDIGHGDWSSHFFMMGFAYLLSLCSTSDAFVAASFAGTFSAGSLLTFMVFGPMLDFKSTLMLLSVFRTRFVLVLAVLIAVTVLLGAVMIEHTVLAGP